MGWTLSKFMPKCKRAINQRVGLLLDCTLFLPGWPFQQCFFFFLNKNDCGLKPCHITNLELPPEERAQNVTRLLRKQAEEVNTEWEKLNLHSADWQRKIDEALERLQELQEATEELDLKLRQAEVIKGSWQPVGDLLIDSLQDHLEKVKVPSIALLQSSLRDSKEVLIWTWVHYFLLTKLKIGPLSFRNQAVFHKFKIILHAVFSLRGESDLIISVLSNVKWNIEKLQS